MMQPVLFLSTLMALGPGLAAATAQERPPAPPAEAKPAPSPAPAQAAPSPAPVAPKTAAEARQAADAGKRPPKTLRMFVGEFRALDLDKKTVTFETKDGKSYTVAAQVPTRQGTLDRAAQLAQILKPGDHIRMLCKVNEAQEPTLILSMHMVDPTAPMNLR